MSINEFNRIGLNHLELPNDSFVWSSNEKWLSYCQAVFEIAIFTLDQEPFYGISTYQQNQDFH